MNKLDKFLTMSWLLLPLTQLYLHFIHSYLRKFYRFFFRVQLKYIFHAAFSWFLWLKNKTVWHAYSVLSPNLTNVLITLWLYMTYISLTWLQLEGGKGFFSRKKFCVWGQRHELFLGWGPNTFLSLLLFCKFGTMNGINLMLLFCGVLLILWHYLLLVWNHLRTMAVLDQISSAQHIFKWIAGALRASDDFK